MVFLEAGHRKGQGLQTQRELMSHVEKHRAQRVSELSAQSPGASSLC